MSACRVSRLLIVALAIIAPASPVWAQSWASKLVEKPNIDFGTVAKGGDAVCRLKVKNVYRDPVSITNIRTSCGCSAATKSFESLAANEEGYIEIKMDTWKWSNLKTSNVFATFSIADFPATEVQIPLRVFIRTDVVLSPGGANFGKADQGQSATKSLNLTYTGRGDWTIQEVKSNSPHVSAKAQETSRVGGQVTYAIAVTLAETAPAGFIKSELQLVTNDAANPVVPVSVDATVESEFTVTPGQLQLGQLTAGEPKLVNLVIRGRKAFSIARIQSEQSLLEVAPKLSPDSKMVHVVPLSVATDGTASEINQNLMIHVEGRLEPLAVRVLGKVRPIETLKPIATVK